MYIAKIIFTRFPFQSLPRHRDTVRFRTLKFYAIYGYWTRRVEKDDH